MAKFPMHRAVAQVTCGRNDDGWGLLHWASYSGCVDTVQYILEKGGVDLNAAAKDGQTPLLIAARLGREKCQQEVRDRSGHREIFDLLLQHGARVNCGRDKDGWTPLHGATNMGWADEVRHMLENGDVDLNAATNEGETPLITAAKEDHREIFYLLLQHGARVNCGRDKNGWTPLHWASDMGWADEVRHILEKGDADLNAATNLGETPLLVAAREEHREIFDLLLQYGARVNSVRDNEGWTPLHSATNMGWADEVRHILEKGDADLNAATNEGETPLITAAKEDHREIFDLLLQYGARVNCGRDEHGWNPLHWASDKGWVDQVRYILEKGGVDLNAAANEGEMPLLLAAGEEHRETFDLLFQYGAQVNCGRDDHGWTSLDSFLKDVDLCTQLIVNKFYRQSLSALYRYPDIAKKLPLLKNFKLKDQQTQQIANFVESEVQTKKFCNVFKAQPIVLMLLCVKSLLSYQSTARKMSASRDSNLSFKKPPLN